MKQDFVTLWKNLANNKQNSSTHHIQYCILRAMAAKSEDKVEIAKHLLRKAFPPVTKQTKLGIGGRRPFDTLTHEIYRLSWYSQTSILGVPLNELLTDEEQVQYKNIISALNEGCHQFVRRYSYFFTRQDIFEEYQLVQTAHAALELGSKLTADQVKDLHFTCCGVADLDELESVERILETMKVPFVVFREPDIGNQKTAIGVYPIEEHRRGLLKNYKLLRFPKPQKEESTNLELIEEVV